MYFGYNMREAPAMGLLMDDWLFVNHFLRVCKRYVAMHWMWLGA